MGKEAIGKMTLQRRVILDALREMHIHPDAAQVYEAVRHTLPTISLGTVYRNLELLSRAGLIGKMEVAGSRMRFDGRTGRHYHVECVKCGMVEDIEPGRRVAVDEQGVSKATRFEIIGYRLEYLGICPRCGGKARGKTRKPGGMLAKKSAGRRATQ